MVLKIKEMKLFWGLPSRQTEFNEKGKKNVILVYVLAFRRGKNSWDILIESPVISKYASIIISYNTGFILSF